MSRETPPGTDFLTPPSGAALERHGFPFREDHKGGERTFRSAPKFRSNGPEDPFSAVLESRAYGTT